MVRWMSYLLSFNRSGHCMTLLGVQDESMYHFLPRHPPADDVSKSSSEMCGLFQVIALPVAGGLQELLIGY
jgi:hypothetical protein